MPPSNITSGTPPDPRAVLADVLAEGLLALLLARHAEAEPERSDHAATR